MIAVVDYFKGNLKSVERGLVSVGAEVEVTADPVRIAQADAIVLPGVGSFADAITAMDAHGQSRVIRRRIKEGVPFLGICLGQHLMFEWGTEKGGIAADDTRYGGLGILAGGVERMPSANRAGKQFKVPHVGWNTIDFEIEGQCTLLDGIAPGEYFYFTHSYIAPSGEFVRAITTHSTGFPSVVQWGEVAFGVQFHPEKSSEAGLVLLKNFTTIAQQN